MDQALESIYNIFADWAVCDFLEEQEFCSFTDQLKKKDEQCQNFDIF